MKQILWEKEVPKNPFSVSRVWKVAASAGCGKTFTIERCINELLADGVKPSSIMYVSYNTLPSLQFRSKFPHFNEEDMRWWATHHAICSRLLKLNPSTRFKKPMERKEMAEFGILYDYDFAEDEDGEDGYEAKKLRLSVSRKQFNQEPLDDEEQAYLENLKSYELENNVKDFNSIIFDTIDLSLFPREVQFVFVDEAQDNGKVQNTYWMRMLETHATLKGFMLVGDDKQAINRYKGGNAEDFLGFQAERNVSFDTSYRCPKPVLEFANAIAEPLALRSPLVEHSASKKKGSVTHPPKLAVICDEILDDLKEHKRVFILARINKTNDMAKSVLREFAVPYASAIHERIRRIFRAFADIKRTGVITAQELDVLSPLTQRKRGPGDLGLTCKYFDKDKRKNYLKQQKNLDKSQLGFLQLYEEEDFGGTKLELAASLGFTEQFIADVLGEGPDPDCFLGKKTQSPVESVKEWVRLYGPDYQAVELLSVHRSKGLEADTVILLGDLDQFSYEREKEELEDARRIWYVAATRSLDKLIVTCVNPRAEFSRLL